MICFDVWFVQLEQDRRDVVDDHKIAALVDRQDVKTGTPRRDPNTQGPSRVIPLEA